MISIYIYYQQHTPPYSYRLPPRPLAEDAHPYHPTPLITLITFGASFDYLQGQPPHPPAVHAGLATEDAGLALGPPECYL